MLLVGIFHNTRTLKRGGFITPDEPKSLVQSLAPQNRIDIFRISLVRPGHRVFKRLGRIRCQNWRQSDPVPATPLFSWKQRPDRIEASKAPLAIRRYVDAEVENKQQLHLEPP